MKKKSNGFSNIMKRDFIEKDEGKLTYLQVFGFMLIAFGIIYFSSFLLPEGFINLIPSIKKSGSPESSVVSIAFFTTMLGVAFAFPGLLKGQTKEISTMRIIVFMFANVICMLLLKIGWEKNSLSEIGLDGFWMGVIAFLFGAKATQYYFENAKTFFPGGSNTNKQIDQTGISKIAIAQIAKVQNEEKLLEKHPSIECVSDTIKDGESCLTLYLSDDNSDGISSFVDAVINETTTVKVKTEVVTNLGKGKPHITQLTNNIANNNTKQFKGSICCLVESTVNNVKGVLTSGHIFTNGKFIDYDGFVNSDQAYKAVSNGEVIGELYFQQMIPNQDIAIVKLNETTSIATEIMKFSSGFYHVSDEDLNPSTENVTILSKENNRRNAYIVDINVSMKIYYDTEQKIMRNIILIGSDIDKNKSITVSVGGDSGSCVYHKDTEKMIGMLLGGNDRFSFVLPFEQTLSKNNFKMI